MTISPEQFTRMKAVANQIGEFFAEDPDERKM
jgi:hypothetical protein